MTAEMEEGDTLKEIIILPEQGISQKWLVLFLKSDKTLTKKSRRCKRKVL